MKKTLIIALLAYGCTISPAFAQAEVLFDLASQLLTNLFQNQDQIKQGDGFTDDASLSKTPASATNADQVASEKQGDEVQGPSSGNPFLRKQSATK